MADPKKAAVAAPVSTDKVELVSGAIDRFEFVPLEALKTNVANIRTGTLPDIPSLMESIEAMGLVTPINAKPGKGDNVYDVVDGFRRLQALIKLHEKYGDKWAKVDFGNIPIAVTDGGNDAWTLLQQATANLQRVDTAPEDLGILVQKLLQPPYNLDIPEVASHLGKKSDFVLDLIKYTDSANDDVKKLVRDGKMTFRTAVDNLQLSPEQQDSIVKLAKATKNKTEAKAKTAKAVAAATGEAAANVASKKGQKELEDRLMVTKGILGDEEIFKTLKKDEVTEVKGYIACLEWTLGQRNTLPLPAKAEEAWTTKYKAKVAQEQQSQETAKFADKAAKAQAQAQAAMKKAQELAEASKLAAAGNFEAAKNKAAAATPQKKAKEADGAAA